MVSIEELNGLLKEAAQPSFKGEGQPDPEAVLKALADAVPAYVVEAHEVQPNPRLAQVLHDLAQPR